MLLQELFFGNKYRRGLVSIFHIVFCLRNRSQEPFSCSGCLARDDSSGVDPIRRCWMLRDFNILLHGDGIRGFLEKLGFGEEFENRGVGGFLVV